MYLMKKMIISLLYTGYLSISLILNNYIFLFIPYVNIVYCV